MSNDKSYIDAGLTLFDGFYKADSVNNEVLFDDNYISEKLSIIKGLVPNLTQENLEELARRIKSTYAIYQPDGVAILGDYEHQDDWYQNLELEEQFFWDRYRLQLLNTGLSPTIVDKLDNDTLNNLMSYIGNPYSEDNFSRKGLVIGDVQSGKTSNYIGLICKAVDAGYKVIFLLTGTIETLRKQTQQRVEEGFIGYDIVNNEDVGVCRGTTVPFSFTSRDKDFVTGADNNTALQAMESGNNPYIFIIKKNVSVLKKILRAINRNLKGNKTIKVPMIMIDDEADNASVNTNNKDNDPTQTNANIRKILALFDKSNYIGFTATPFANIFIDPETDDEMLKNDLFPRDFIYALFPPSNYHGAKKMFVDVDDESDKFMIEYIDKTETDITHLDEVFPVIHKKDFKVSKLPKSAYEAILRFIIANTIRDLRGQKKEPRSMLVNLSRFTDVQFSIAEEIEKYANFGDIRPPVSVISGHF